MHLLPTQDEVLGVLRASGALRDGHFVYPNGLHSSEYLQVPLAMRYYPARQNAQRRVEPAAAGRSRDPRDDSGAIHRGPGDRRTARRLWRLRSAAGQTGLLGRTRRRKAPLRFRQYIEPQPGEQVIMVDDILRSGRKLSELKTLLESYMARRWSRWRWSFTSRPRAPAISEACPSNIWPVSKPATTPMRRPANLCGKSLPTRKSMGLVIRLQQFKTALQFVGSSTYELMRGLLKSVQCVASCRRQGRLPTSGAIFHRFFRMFR